MSQFRTIYKERIYLYRHSIPFIIKLLIMFSPFYLNTWFLKGTSDTLDYVYLGAISIGLTLFPQQLIIEHKILKTLQKILFK